jgi:hypothetical protein
MGFGQWIKAGIAGGSIIGFGALNFIYNTPTDEELINKLSPELKKKYYEERERRRYISNWAVGEAQKTARSEDPIWMTGEIPSGMVPGEDGRGKRAVYDNRVTATGADEGRLVGEGLAGVPDSLRQQQSAWLRREQEEKSTAVEAERQRLRKLAEQEGKL